MRESASSSIFPVQTAFPENDTSGQIRLLTASSSPMDLVPLDVESEMDKIQSAIARALQQDNFNIYNLANCRIRQLVETIDAFKPTIIHISGHGGEKSLFFQNDFGRGVEVEKERLEGLVRDAHDHGQLKALFLNACFSAPDAYTTFAHIGVCVIAIQQPVDDDAAIFFAKEFYGKLAQGLTFRVAFDRAKNATRAVHSQTAISPEFYSK
jgi:hypothetical protein